jgi:anthranilate/para-aminobenzoate synthase component II
MFLRVRFRPESIMTEVGKNSLKNSLKQGTQQ